MSTTAQKTRHPSIREMAGMSQEQRQALIWKRQVVEHEGRRYSLDIGQAARAYGEAHGYSGARGGWIYYSGSRDGSPVCQGWTGLWHLYAVQIRRWLMARAEHYPNPIPTTTRGTA